MICLKNLYDKLTTKLFKLEDFIPVLLIRIFVAWEFYESGIEKYFGENWFADISFPFPFNILPPSINWGLATWFEIIGSIAILIGLGTRFFALSLMVITIIAILVVHFPVGYTTISEFLMGYRIIDEANDGFGNYKLPVIYLIMLVYLFFHGAGKLSIDNLINKIIKNKCKG